MRYHISPKTGRPNICRATKKGCPLGGEQEHYKSKEEAQAAYEASKKQEEMPPVARKDASLKTNTFQDPASRHNGARALQEWEQEEKFGQELAKKIPAYRGLLPHMKATEGEKEEFLKAVEWAEGNLKESRERLQALVIDSLFFQERNESFKASLPVKLGNLMLEKQGLPPLGEALPPQPSFNPQEPTAFAQGDARFDPAVAWKNMQEEERTIAHYQSEVSSLERLKARHGDPTPEVLATYEGAIQEARLQESDAQDRLRRQSQEVRHYQQEVPGYRDYTPVPLQERLLAEDAKASKSDRGWHTREDLHEELGVSREEVARLEAVGALKFADRGHGIIYKKDVEALKARTQSNGWRPGKWEVDEATLLHAQASPLGGGPKREVKLLVGGPLDSRERKLEAGRELWSLAGHDAAFWEKTAEEKKLEWVDEREASLGPTEVNVSYDGTVSWRGGQGEGIVALEDAAFLE